MLLSSEAEQNINSRKKYSSILSDMWNIFDILIKFDNYAYVYFQSDTASSTVPWDTKKRVVDEYLVSAYEREVNPEKRNKKRSQIFPG